MTSPTPQDAAERIKPVLKAAEDSLEHHLDEACDVRKDGVHEESTEELLRLEDELLAAARAVERTVTIRKVMEASACDDETLASAAAAGHPPPCLVREFADRQGRPWRVWQVRPGREREGLHGERLLGAFASGWLAFEALDDGSRRRLLGNADGWETRNDEELIPLLDESIEVPKRPPRPSERSETAPKP